jgi:hypothetical protein
MADLIDADPHPDAGSAHGPAPSPAGQPSAGAGEGLTFRWHTTSEEVAGSWPACFPPGHVLASRELQRACEASGLEEVGYQYLVASDGRGLDGLLPCFTFRVSLVTIAPPWLQAAVARIRRLWPSFLMVRLFVVGTPLSTCSDLLGLGEHRAGARWDERSLRLLFAEVTRKAGSLGIGLTLIKEFSGPMRDRLQAALGQTFIFVDSLPTTYLPLPRTRSGGYLTAIRSKYRNKLKHRVSIARARGLRWETRTDVGQHAEEIYRLYRQVLDRSDTRFEQLTPAFFQQALIALPGLSFLLLGFAASDSGERMVACELVLCDRLVMHPIYSGFDYTVKEQGALYFNTFYRLIEEAEARGCSAVHIGQTAYEVKAELGALAHPLHLGVHHGNPLMRFILARARALLFPLVHCPYRAVFSAPDQAISMIGSLGISLDIITLEGEADAQP